MGTLNRLGETPREGGGGPLGVFPEGYTTSSGRKGSSREGSVSDLGDESLSFAFEPTSLGTADITKPGSLGRLHPDSYRNALGCKSSCFHVTETWKKVCCKGQFGGSAVSVPLVPWPCPRGHAMTDALLGMASAFMVGEGELVCQMHPSPLSQGLS